MTISNWYHVAQEIQQVPLRIIQLTAH